MGGHGLRSRSHPCKEDRGAYGSPRLHHEKNPQKCTSTVHHRTKTMMNVNRQFLNLVVKDNFIRTGVCSLRRIKAADHLFYPSTSDGHKPGAAASCDDQLPAHGTESIRGDPSLDFVSLLGDEGRTLCVDSSGHTSLYDADTHSVLTMTSLEASKGHDAIPISVFRAADGRGK
ncbi:hypothetical protein PR202_ga13506 [Eleusine coracana subsp. coracana]|uniref:Uncharacterized protein n=1 Tax=Eleusine coracana subsp. coracana TaxID=191504 RepID=A0AAV5CEN8_ELECO|nr:hypothetical protein PR202_ga13506 [Eleusine coracana subsp. coracana]